MIKTLFLVFCAHAFILCSVSAADFAVAREALAQENYGLAWQLAKDATVEHPKDPEGWIVLGHALSGKLEQAPFLGKARLAQETKDAYQHAIDLSPQNVEAHVSLFEYCRQAPSIVGGGRASALEELLKIETIDPGAAYPCKIRLATDDGKSPQALALCEALFRLEPHSFRACYWLATTLSASGMQPQRVINLLQETVTLTPRGEDPGLDDAYAALGAALEAVGKKKSATDAYSRALKINPHNAIARRKVEGG